MSAQSPLSPAVLHCWTAYEQSYAIERGKGATDNDAYEDGKMAYRQAIPCLSDQASIRDFIACVTHGMVLNLISNEDGGKLLYAANIAAGFLRRESKSEPAAQPQNQSQTRSQSEPAVPAPPSQPAPSAHTQAA